MAKHEVGLAADNNQVGSYIKLLSVDKAWLFDVPLNNYIFKLFNQVIQVDLTLGFFCLLSMEEFRLSKSLLPFGIGEP